MVGSVDRIDRIVSALGSHEAPRLPGEGKRLAAVAMVIRERDAGAEVLFIERARHESDPWSGHMAFPGGRVDPVDPHPRAAAERETHEEVGIPLDDALYVGRLPDLPGRGAAPEHGLVISGHVYVLEQDVPLAIDRREVEQAFWFPLRALHEAERHVPHTVPGMDMEFPGILVGEPGRHVVWGLTYRFLEEFFGIVGAPLPVRWRFDRDAVMGDEERPELISSPASAPRR
jgi:8-oxo-dGTP pyrophosphatase MutT (NUDIX family)